MNYFFSGESQWQARQWECKGFCKVEAKIEESLKFLYNWIITVDNIRKYIERSVLISIQIRIFNSHMPVKASLLLNVRRPVTGFMADFVKLNKVHIFSETCKESCLEHCHEDLEDGDDVLCSDHFSHLMRNKLFQYKQC
jgi:hypothetical protein